MSYPSDSYHLHQILACFMYHRISAVEQNGSESNNDNKINIDFSGINLEKHCSRDYPTPT